jgi:hypothetical protein
VAASSFVGNPEFGSGGASDTHDIAVVLLRQAPAGITPARLPTAGLLDQLKASHQLDEQTFTAVGYGTVREDKTGGPHSLFFDGVRRYALQHALNLEKAWLLLSNEPLHRQRWDLLRRLGRPALPGRGAEQSGRVDHHHR